MKIEEMMVKQVQVIEAGNTVATAAQLMAEHDIGFLPVSENDKLIGVVTDRDIAVRVVAAGLDPAETLVETAMTAGTKYCYVDEDADHVVRNMAEQEVCRLPVMNRDKQLVGIVSIDDLMPQRPPMATAPVEMRA